MPAAGPTGKYKGNPNALGAAEARAVQRQNVVRETLNDPNGRPVPVPSYPRVPDAKPASNTPSPAQRAKLRNAKSKPGYTPATDL